MNVGFFSGFFVQRRSASAIFQDIFAKQKLPQLKLREYVLSKLRSLGVNAYLTSAACNMLELNSSVDEREECIVGAATYVITGMDSSTSLTENNATGSYVLTVSSLNAKAL